MEELPGAHGVRPDTAPSHNQSSPTVTCSEESAKKDFSSSDRGETKALTAQKTSSLLKPDPACPQLRTL